jgi:cyclopropane fatty-acyl-phospholipid synthase-like methyltransferase
MTIWDNIYKKYQKGGDAWATLSEEIHPLFKQFLNESSFDLKNVLDIGCGTGKYLKILQPLGFKTNGIDSSETAVKMTKKILGDNSNILLTDMFEFEITNNQYDLIISVSTIHHGTKQQIKELINKIYNALSDNGKIFITVPDFESGKKWNTFKDHEEITESTFSPITGPEKGLPHSFYTEKQTGELFSQFSDLQIDLDGHGRWVVRGSK